MHVEGQFLDLVCSIDINQYINSPVTVSVTWNRNGTTLTNGNDFIISSVTGVQNMYNNTLRINDLRNDRDNYGLYSCLVNVTSMSPFITSSIDNIASIVLRVAGK